MERLIVGLPPSKEKVRKVKIDGTIFEISFARLL